MSHVVSSNCLHIGIDVGLKSGWVAVVIEEEGVAKLIRLEPLYCGHGTKKTVMPAKMLYDNLHSLHLWWNPFVRKCPNRECRRKFYIEKMTPNKHMIGLSSSVTEHYTVIMAFLELQGVTPVTIHPHVWQKHITHLDNEDSRKYKESVRKPPGLHKKIIYNWVKHNVPCSKETHTFEKAIDSEMKKCKTVKDAYDIPHSYGYTDAIAIAYLGEKITEGK